jgi:hypothetical protein
MWNYPRFSDRPLTGWRVTWGQRLHLLQPSLPRPLLPDGSISGSPILDERNAAVSQVIPESELEFTINDLEEATDYIFQVSLAVLKVEPKRIEIYFMHNEYELNFSGIFLF